MDSKRGLIFILIVLLVAMNIINFFAMTSITGKATQTASGVTSLCINNPPSLTAIANQAATVSTAFSLQATANDTAGQTLTYYDNTSLFDIDSTGLVSFTPSSAQIGTHHILITVSDTQTCIPFNVSDDFILTVSAAAEPSPTPTPAAGGGGGGGGGGGSGGGKAKAVTSIVLTPEPQTASTGEGESLQFNFAGERHTITVTSLQEERVGLLISSTPQKVIFIIGEDRDIDLDDDTIVDINIKFESIRNERAVLKIKLLRKGLILSQDVLKVRLSQSQSIEKQAFIVSDWPKELSISLINDLPDIISLEPRSLILPANEEQEIIITLNPQKQAAPGIYTDTLTVVGKNAADLFDKALITILEIESDQLHIDASLDLASKTLLLGQPLEATITLFNLARVSPTSLSITYTISDTHNTILMQEQEAITIEEQASFVKQIPLTNLPPGQYVIGIQIRYNESIATATELFSVAAPVEEQALVGLAAFIRRPAVLVGVPSAIILVIIVISILLFLLHRKVGKVGVAKTAKLKQVIIVKKAAPSPPAKPDTSRLDRKLSLLKESYVKGYIKEETYQKTRQELEKIRGS